MMHMHHLSLKAEEAACACTALRKASRAVSRIYDEALEGEHMSIVQFSILRHIAREGDLPLMRLADLLVMDRTTLYRALKPVEQRGWVRLGNGAGRAKLAGLTDAGRKALQQATGTWQKAQAALLTSFGAQEWAEIEAGLNRLVALTARGRA